MRRLLRTVTATAATALIVLVAAGAASAGTRTFPDPVGDSTTSSDIDALVVRNVAVHDRFTVRVQLDRVVLGTAMTVWVDRNRRNPGPELRMVAAPDSEWALYRVDRWGQRGTQIRTCGRVGFSTSTAPVVVWRASRSCLHIGGGVRVAARLTGPHRHSGVDWAPARRTFSPRVSAH